MTTTTPPTPDQVEAFHRQIDAFRRDATRAVTTLARHLRETVLPAVASVVRYLDEYERVRRARLSRIHRMYRERHR